MVTTLQASCAITNMSINVLVTSVSQCKTPNVIVGWVLIKTYKLNTLRNEHVELNGSLLRPHQRPSIHHQMIPVLVLCGWKLVDTDTCCGCHCRVTTHQVGWWGNKTGMQPMTASRVRVTSGSRVVTKQFHRASAIQVSRRFRSPSIGRKRVKLNFTGVSPEDVQLFAKCL